MLSSGAEFSLPDNGVLSCYVCHSEINYCHVKRFASAKIIGQNDALDDGQPRPSEAVIICEDCIWKINTYDLACVTFGNIPAELRPLMRSSNDASTDQPSAMEVVEMPAAAVQKPENVTKQWRRMVLRLSIHSTHAHAYSRCFGKNRRPKQCARRRPPTRRSICDACIRKLNKNDLACMTSGNIVAEVRSLMRSSNDATTDQPSAMEVVADLNNVFGGGSAAERIWNIRTKHRC